MLIGKNWQIKADANNVTLSRSYYTKLGKEVWRTHGYFATVGSALRELIYQEVRETQLKNLKTILAKIDSLETILNRVVSVCGVQGMGQKLK